IAALPFSDAGNTCGYVDDYDEICPWSSFSPDVAYSYAPASNITIDISLCNSLYDTKVYVYEGGCPGTLVACNDDSCGYQSELIGVSLTGGNTYYIIVDGYGGDCGDYIIDVTSVPLPNCPPDTLFGQPVHGPGDPWAAINSDANSGYLVYENFWDVNGYICDIHFWGMDVYYDPILGWIECDEDPMTFEIKFYQDAGGQPGAEMCSYTIPITRTATGLQYSGFDLWEYSTTLSPCCGLTDGWVSIQGVSIGNPDCWFLWMSSGTGDGLSYQWDGASLVQRVEDLSLCLTGEECYVECPPGGTDENEPNCGLPVDTVNGGCNSSPPVFSPISCGETVCGTAAWDGGTRDTDWYEIVTTKTTKFTWTVEAEFLVQAIIIDAGSGNCIDETILDNQYADECEEISMTTAYLPAGTYWFFVAPDFAGPAFACGRKYVATLTCEVKPFSYPETLLWQIELPADRVESQWVGYDQFPERPSDTCFQYYVELDPEEWFWQSRFLNDTQEDIFWISIAAVYPEDWDIIDFMWGWKTRAWPWMDDAVTFDVQEDPVAGFTNTDPNLITPLKDAMVCGEPNSYDVAFELNTEPYWIKWEQAFTGIRHWPHYEDELSMAIDESGEPNIIRLVADDWLCDQITPITAAVWWGSYIDYRYKACECEQMPQPAKPDYFLLSIWTDVPAGGAASKAKANLTAGQAARPVKLAEALPIGDLGDRDISRSAAPSVGSLVYANWDAVPINSYFTPGSGYPMADDIDLAGTERQLTHYDFAVYSETAAPYTVTSELYTDSAGYPGAAIAGTYCAHNVAVDGYWWLDCAPGSGAILPNNLWMVLAFDTDYAGWTIGEQAETGSTDDVFAVDDPPWTLYNFGGWPAYEYAGFEADIWCEEEVVVPEFSHPNEKIWEYRAYDYDEVLVGYDKHPHGGPVIFDGGAPDLVNCNEMTNWAQAEDFTLTVATTITSVRFWTLEAIAAWDGSCDYAIHTDVAGAPGALVDSGSVALGRLSTGRTAFAMDEWENEFDLPAPLPLAAGTYWLVLHMSSDCLTRDEVYWETGSPGFGSTGLEDSQCTGGPWMPNSYHHAFQLLSGAGYEPVFRYSVKLPEEEWFFQDEPNGVYWFSAVAVYEDVPDYNWGWTNHEHEFNDDAVAGFLDTSGDWVWEELYDQNEASEDMSFILFTEPDCLSMTAPEYADWVALGKPDCWCYRWQCRGDIDGIQTGPFHVAIPDLAI
ncbi:MAG: DUF7901 domain-containing protein, partial [Planctomycetota bacterium]